MSTAHEVEFLIKRLEEIRDQQKVEAAFPWLLAEFKRFKKEKLRWNEIQPAKFPVTHSEFLKLVLPKRLYGRTADQAELYKKWLLYELQSEWLLLSLANPSELAGKMPPIDQHDHEIEACLQDPEQLNALRKMLEESFKQIENRYKQHRAESIDEPIYWKRAFSFLTWHRKYSRQQTSQARRRAAISSHIKRKNKQTKK